MKILIAEDDFMSRKLMLACLVPVGECDVAVSGTEAVEAFTAALSEQKPYDLVMLDIMMPGLDGQAVLKQIRALEEDQNGPGGNCATVIMTTALRDSHNVMGAFINQCDGYLTKPIEFDDVQELLKKLHIIT